MLTDKDVAKKGIMIKSNISGEKHRNPKFERCWSYEEKDKKKCDYALEGLCEEWVVLNVGVESCSKNWYRVSTKGETLDEILGLV